MSSFDARRLKAADELEVIAGPCVFSGSTFPNPVITKPADFAEVFGRYTIQTTYYNSVYEPADSAKTAGRYGAIVEITTESGRRFERYLTLFHQPQSINWEGAAMSAVIRFPRELGIGDDVASQQQRAVSEFFKIQLQKAADTTHDTAIMLAGLFESQPNEGPFVARNGFIARDQRWWFGLRMKLGTLHHRYKIYLPLGYAQDATKHWPTILFLHGSGEAGEDLDRVQLNGLAKLVKTRPDFPFIVVMPQCAVNEWWSPWMLNDLLDEVQAKYRMDADRLYLTGLSLGGYGTWDTAIAFPDRFAAIVPICGAGDENDVARIKDIPAWVFHGWKDPIVPIREAERMVEALKKVGGRVRFTVFPEAHHNAWDQAYAMEELYNWLLQQRRGKPVEPPAVVPVDALQ